MKNRSQNSKVACCTGIRVQHATFKDQNATGGATMSATTDLKALARKVLERNNQCNTTATTAQKECNFNAISGGQKLHPVAPQKARAYGCAKCGNKIYTVVKMWELVALAEPEPFKFQHRQTTAWKCEGCGSVFSIIGGAQGPQYLT